MICPDCNGNDPQCFRCDGTGDVCDVCGEACAPGQSAHPDCLPDAVVDDTKKKKKKKNGPAFSRVALPIQYPTGVQSIASQGIKAPRTTFGRENA